MSRDLSKYRDVIIEGISELVKISTVYDAASVTGTMPYGINVYLGLEWLKEKAIKDGFEVLEYDGHALAIRMKGKKSGKRIDVVSHMDVVEPGEGWSENPFSGSITKEYIYGRGTQDMKGPLMVTYYALKFIKDHNISCKNEIRVVIGCDEERTMDDIRYYIAKAGEPDFAFTPDGKFPLSYGEKGALMWRIEANTDTCILELKGGVQCNVISPVATALVGDSDKEQIYREMLSQAEYQGEIVQEAEHLRITIHGKAAHASRPQDGSSATVQLLDLIQKVSHDSLARLLYSCFSDSYGKGADMEYDFASLGKLTINLGILKIRDKKVTADIDCRYPLGITSEVLTEKLMKVLESFKVVLKYDDKPTLSDVSSPYIKALLNTYRSVSKDAVTEPMISGGVTYSKVFTNCVAFGPMSEGEIQSAHQADERIEIKKLDKLFEIYLESILCLSNL